MKATVQVLGLKELQETLTRALPAKAQRNAVAAALRKGARPMVQAARSGYQRHAQSGSLAKSVTVWRSRKDERRRGGTTFASVELGPKRGNKKALAQYYAYHGRTPRPADLMLGIRHGHLVEWGTRRGTQPQRILTRAFDQHGRRAIEIFRQELGAAIEKEAAKRGRIKPT